MTRDREIAGRLAEVRARIEEAERAAGRPPASVLLVAVSKTMPPSDLRAALDAGQADLGESYAQELRDKRAALADVEPRVRWHFIGPVQRNKVKYVAGRVALIHAVDSIALLDQIDARVPKGGLQRCLVQVNVASEARKHGIAPAELPALLDRFAALPRVRCDGLMLIPPLAPKPEAARPFFAALRRLRDQEAARARPHVELRELSMGMTADLDGAIAEGATIVRVGTAIFGARPRLDAA